MWNSSFEYWKRVLTQKWRLSWSKRFLKPQFPFPGFQITFTIRSTSWPESWSASVSGSFSASRHFGRSINQRKSWPRWLKKGGSIWPQWGRRWPLTSHQMDKFRQGQTCLNGNQQVWTCLKLTDIKVNRLCIGLSFTVCPHSLRNMIVPMAQTTNS